MRLLMTALTGLLVVSAVPSVSEAQAPTKSQLASLLSGYEHVPTARQLRALGPGTPSVLIDLYSDRSQPTYVRMRAVAGVAHFPSPAIRTFLLAVARAARQSDLFIRRAVLSLGQAFGAAAIDDVRPFLSHGYPVVRRAAGIALTRIDDPRARVAVETRITNESDRVVREALIDSLRTSASNRGR